MFHVITNIFSAKITKITNIINNDDDNENYQPELVQSAKQKWLRCQFPENTETLSAEDLNMPWCQQAVPENSQELLQQAKLFVFRQKYQHIKHELFEHHIIRLNNDNQV